MATKKEKEELMATLKFTPRTYQLLIQGYGGECYAGRVERKIYDYFKAQKIDMEEYASSYDEFEGMPVDMQPFSPGAPFECDNMFHASGAELSDLNSIEVYDENGDTHWESTAGLNDLEDAGVTVEEFDSTDFDDLAEGEVVFWGGQGEKGCFFDGEIYLTAPFDPKKLKIIYETCDGWSIINYVEYDGEEIDGSGGYSTTGKWGDAKWILGGDEEVYSETVSAEDREDEGLTWDNWDPAAELEKIEVPVEISDSKDTFDWSPLPDYDCVQCDWQGTVDELVDNDGDLRCPECGEPVETHVPVLEGEEEWAQKAIDDSMKTDWFEKSVNPVHKGEYECEFEIATWPWPAIRTCEWTGRTWKDSTGEKVQGNFKWRGLKEEFKDE